MPKKKEALERFDLLSQKYRHSNGGVLHVTAAFLSEQQLLGNLSLDIELEGLVDAPEELDNYFLKQGAAVVRMSVGGCERLGLRVAGKPGFHALGARVFGWTKQSLWTSWCQQQLTNAWHENLIEQLIVEAINRGESGILASSQWLDRKLVQPTAAKQRGAWPWSVILRDHHRAPLTWGVDAQLWTHQRPLNLDILAMSGVCLADQFNPTYPDEYVRAIQSRFRIRNKVWLDSQTSRVQGDKTIKRL